jgi:hypothetical protein
MARADALLVIPEDAELTPAGTVRQAIPLADDVAMSTTFDA